MSEEKKPDQQQKDNEDKQAEAAARISPRGARHGWTPEECRNFEAWDNGGEV